MMPVNIPFREDYPPRNDIVFSIMFGEIDLFSALLKSVTGHVLDADEVISQASVTPDNVEHNYSKRHFYSPIVDLLKEWSCLIQKIGFVSEIALNSDIINNLDRNNSTLNE